MIEKISPYDDGKHIVGQFNNYEMGEKINELIDVVNALVYENDKDSDWYDDPKHREQRKWIGKLCRFWNFKDGAVDIGILKAVDNLKPSIPYINDIDCSYAFCEPVKPDDDIIYRGE